MVINGPAARTRASAKQSTSTSRRESIQNNSRTTTATIVKRSSLQAPITPNNSSVQLAELLTRVSALEKANTELRIEVVELKAIVTGQEATIRTFKLATEANTRGVSIEQEEINSNIVIRGLETTENSSHEELSCIYDGLRAHLSVSGVSELDPVELRVLPALPGQDSTTKRPLVVKLKSIAAKKTLLQTRRQKRDIFPRDFGLQQTSKRPILITEHLTKENQNLLYQARSLRGPNGYKFVWSSNGQVLARRKKNSRVIRVTDILHLNALRAEINLSPLSHHGDRHSTNCFRTSAGSPTV